MTTAPATAPAIDTEHLTLRGHRLEDFDECVALWTDPVVLHYFGGKPSTREEVWTRLLRYAGHWALLGFGYWVVRDKATGRFVGEVGFADYKRGIEPSLDGKPEGGWVLAPWAHGRGLATEAVRAALAWSTPQFGTRRTTCIIRPDNLPSLRVAEKCGYREVGRTTYHGEPIIVLDR